MMPENTKSHIIIIIIITRFVALTDPTITPHFVGVLTIYTNNIILYRYTYYLHNIILDGFAASFVLTTPRRRAISSYYYNHIIIIIVIILLLLFCAQHTRYSHRYLYILHCARWHVHIIYYIIILRYAQYVLEASAA